MKEAQPIRTEHIEPTDNPVALRMRNNYAKQGAEFSRPELEAGWREIWRLEAELEQVRQERDDVQRAKYGTPCKCESWIEACRVAEERAEASESREKKLRGALEHYALTDNWARCAIVEGNHRPHWVGPCSTGCEIARRALEGE